MKKSLKTLSIILTLLFLFGPVFTGCSKKDNSTDTEKSSTININSNNKKDAKNPLTGMPIEKEYKDNRPIAIMINNIETAQPLLGVSEADLMYECLVEGGITRIMAVFQSTNGIEKIGSVRSARPDFINIAAGLDTIYMHIGGSAEATKMLKTDIVDSFDLGAHSNMMWRDQTRMNNLGFEHSALTSGDKLINGIKSSNIDTKVSSSYSSGQNFSEKSSISSGNPAQKASATFSYYKTTTFTYDSNKETYMISQFGEAQMDANTNVQNSKQNILILSVKSYTVDSEGHMKMDLVGNTGTGKYLSHGKYIDIKWSKDSQNAPIKYKTSNGDDLKMLPGQVYICMIPTDETINIE